MIYVFIPYYNEDTPEFKKSLESQTLKLNKDYKVIKRNRKRDKIYWTKAVRDFQREIKRFCGAKDDDVVCIMNNDIEFKDILFEEGQNVKSGGVFIPFGIMIDWSKKAFYFNRRNFQVNSFDGHCFFMTLGDFKKFKFSRFLPHYLADIDFGIRVMKKNRCWFTSKIIHKDHPRKEGKLFSILNDKNPIFWTIFLLKHPNKYTFINILKSWYEIFR